MDQQLHTGVVVGVDESEGSSRAVRFAALEAERRGTSLTVVHVVPDFVASASPAYAIPDDFRHEIEASARSLLGAAAEAASRTAAGVPVSQALVAGRTVSSLVHEAGHASHIVLGRETVSPPRRLVTGAVTLGVAARAHQQVVSVPSSWSPEHSSGKVVAGYKSAQHSEELLAASFAEADARGARLVLVHGWVLPGMYDDLIVTRTRRDEWSRDAQARIERELAGHRARHQDVPVEIKVVHDLAAHAIAEEAADADLLVLVRRAHGFPPALHLGGTARALLKAAACPVLVLPPQLPRHEGEDPARAVTDVPLAAGTRT